MSAQHTPEVAFDPSATPLELASSLTDIEAALTPFLSKEWAGQVESLGPLERAKLDVMMAYTIVDLIWVYLKMKGVDPAKHEVTPELERVRGYYAKIRNIEDPQAGARKYKLDIPAAGRFILNGIPTKQRLGNPSEGNQSLPQTSAAGAAQAGRERAAREQEEASIARMGKSGRMRFVASEAEKVVPGDDGTSQDDDEMADEALGGDEDGEEGEGGEDAVEVIEVDDEDSDSDFELLDGPPGSGSGTRTPAEQAGDLFAEIDAGLANAKRKRAEEF